MPEPEKERRPLSWGEWSAIVIAVLLIGGAAWFWVRSRSAPPPTAEPIAAPGPETGATAPSGPAPVVSDERARSLLESLSSNPAYRRWLSAGDLIRRWTVVTLNVAEGTSPRRELDFLAPSKPFTAATQNGRAVIAPASYHRYDELADAVASLDAKAFSQVYRELHPALEGAYRLLGYPGSFDSITARALQRLESAPVRDGEVTVEGKGPYIFADAKLEALGAVEKHLLRMGPRNTRLLQAKAKELSAALALPAPEASKGR
jgi:hypothetical protein